MDTMQKTYSISDVAKMSGLSTRTIRNYIKTGILNGEKVSGIWQFTSQDFCEFISNSSVKPSIQAHRNGIVYDFMRDDKKETQKICIILDDILDEACSQKTIEQICQMINSYDEMKEDIRFNLEKHNDNTRILISGNLNTIYDFLKKYQNLESL